MTKSSTNKKNKKLNSGDIELEYDVSIFEVRDRHQASLLAIKKKIRACEKKIRELEQTEQQKLTEQKNGVSKESDEVKQERREKIDNKKFVLDIWKEAAISIASIRKKEVVEGVTNICIADVTDGINLLREVLAKDKLWDHYKCTSKKLLSKLELERIRQLAIYLNVSTDENLQSNFHSFLSVIDYLSSPVAIGQECPMSFCEFVRLFDKIRKTLSVEIVVALTPEPKENVEASTSLISTKVAHNNEVNTDVINTDNQPIKSTGLNKNKNKRQRKTGNHKNHKDNGTTTTPTNDSNVITQSVSSIPEKLTVVVTDNKKTDELSPIVISSDEQSKSVQKIEPPKVVPPGQLIHNPNVPRDEDSDGEGWETADSSRKKKSPKPFRNGPKRNPNSGFKTNNVKLGGNFKKDGTDSKNQQFKHKKPQQPFKSSNTTGVAAKANI